MFFVFWGASVLFSVGCDCYLLLSIYKDVAEQGYKLNNRNFNEFLNQNVKNDEQKLHFVKNIIPFFNVLFKMEEIMKRNQAKPFIADQMRVTNCVERFTKEEEEKYKNKPTLFNAIKISIKSDIDKISRTNIEKQVVEYEQSITLLETLKGINSDFDKAHLDQISPEETFNLIKERLKRKQNDPKEDVVQAETIRELSNDELIDQLFKLREILIEDSKPKDKENTLGKRK